MELPEAVTVAIKLTALREIQNLCHLSLSSVSLHTHLIFMNTQMHMYTQDPVKLINIVLFMQMETKKE